jgi:hypothetical protein
MQLQNVTSEMVLHFEITEVIFQNLKSFEKKKVSSERNFRNGVYVFQTLCFNS